MLLSARFTGLPAPTAALLALGLGALGGVACTSAARSLVVVDATAAPGLPTVAVLDFAVGNKKTSGVAGPLPVSVGLYVPGDAAEQQVTVTAYAMAGGCAMGAGAAKVTPAAGQVVHVSVVVASKPCTGGDGGSDAASDGLEAPKVDGGEAGGGEAGAEGGIDGPGAEAGDDGGLDAPDDIGAEPPADGPVVDAPPDGGASLAAPAPLRPWNGEPTGSVWAAESLKPRFRWRPVAGADHYQLQVDDSCTTPGFAACAFASPERDVTTAPGDGATHKLTAPLAASTAVPVGRRYYWRVRACDAFAVCGGWSAARYFDAGRLRDDFDGDGYSEVIFMGEPSSRTVFMLRGGATPDNVPDKMLSGASSYFGDAIAFLGDVDADGFADLAIADWQALSGWGQVSVYSGNAAGDPASPKVWVGSSSLFNLGFSVIGAGDVNADGYVDVAVGVFRADMGATPGVGAALVFRGGSALPDVPDWTLLGTTASEHFGAGLASGDFDGDGRSDLVVSSYNALGNAGRIALYRRIASGAPTIVGRPGEAGGDFFGQAVASAGDVDDDGYPDFLVGAPSALSVPSSAGRAYLFKGAATPSLASAAMMWDGAAADDGLGYALAGAADYDGDGKADYALGAPYVAVGGISRTGRVFGFSSASASTSLGSAILTVTGPDASFTGGALGFAQDMNGDGRADLIIGAPEYGVGSMTDVGRVLIFFGPKTTGTADLTVVGAATDAIFGTVVD